MIYIENKDGVQRVVIPTNDTNVEYVNFVPQEGDSDYYTKEQTDEKISQSSTAVLGEVGDWLSHYATTDYVHDAVENVTVDLTGYATEQWVKDQNYTTDEWVLQQNYATEDYVDAEIQKIPKPDMSDYYTKKETDDKIDNALLGAPLMLEHAGFATQNWVKDQNYTTDEWVLQQNYATEDWVEEQGYVTKQYVDDAVANVPTGGGGSGDMSDYYTKGEVDTVKDDLQGQITDNKNAINDNKNAIKDLDSRVEKLSDKYATKAYVDDLIININNTLSKI